VGGLIQTKGTQRLARLFNDLFKAASIGQTRLVKNSSGTSLQGAFASLPDLRSISDNFIAQYASNHWVATVQDVLYPAATLVAVTIAPGAVAGTTYVTFNDPNAGWPPLIANGISAADLDHPVGVPKGTTVSAVDHATPVAGQTRVTFNAVVTAQVGDHISFCPVKHQNLVRRWRYYLGNELVASNHTAIQSAVLTALTDSSVTSVRFQAIESSTQTVFVETIFATTNAEDDNLDPKHKHLFVALMTARTNAPDPVDDP
jgi:hypothetical protein